ncbi:Glycerophosphodiester phosphodiesterase domain-containing protein 5 [Labeo rohita]|uniref:Glycerophosphodiester phosphodiesterase domain-containing protein 5 n=1 Tax=Labeo rohita TaxID=84645 RepID=A0ABQ8M449_LABRO|nr:Glycerophosphodiester phosphodiesterase domain-containing protein 5 [Labeo rohita]
MPFRAGLGRLGPGGPSAEEYGLIWITSDLISVVIVIGIFIFQKWKMSGMRSYNPEQIMLSTVVRRLNRDVNLIKEKLIFSAPVLQYIQFLKYLVPLGGAYVNIHEDTPSWAGPSSASEWNRNH